MSTLSLLKPALSETLSVILPTSEETLVLRACLLSGESARHAWEEWQRRRNEFANGFLGDDESIKKLRPLVFNALRRHGIEVDKESRTYLRFAYLKEELRNNIFRRICRDVLLLLARGDIPTIVLKGVALAETVYDNPALRHCHDIDLLLRDHHLNRAAELLRPLGFQEADPKGGWGSKDCRLKHESGLSLELHSRLFVLDYSNRSLAEMWNRSEYRLIAGVQGRILSPADNLLHVCGHAFYSAKRRSLRWVCDAWFLIDRYQDLDWDLLMDCAHQSRLTLALSVTLGYLAENLKAPIPTSFLDRLFATAANTDGMERELALFPPFKTAL